MAGLGETYRVLFSTDTAWYVPANATAPIIASREGQTKFALNAWEMFDINLRVVTRITPGGTL